MLRLDKKLTLKMIEFYSNKKSCGLDKFVIQINSPNCDRICSFVSLKLTNLFKVSACTKLKQACYLERHGETYKVPNRSFICM